MMKILKNVVVLSVMALSICLCQNKNNQSGLLRLGSPYGGWIIPSGWSEKSVCYCVGAGEDITFDIELAKKFGCDVFVIDPTPRALAHFNYVKESLSAGSVPHTRTAVPVPYVAPAQVFVKLHFLAYGIWTKDEAVKFYSPKVAAHVSHSIVNLQQTSDYFEAPCKKISTLMKELGHDHIDLLKMDIEGAEYAVIENFLQEKVSIRCLCVEFHEVASQRHARVLKLLQLAGFDLAHHENKNYTFVYGK